MLKALAIGPKVPFNTDQYKTELSHPLEIDIRQGEGML